MNGFALDKQPPQKIDRSLMDDDGAREVRLFHCSARLWVRGQLWRQESFCFAT